jgi:two-component system, CitB family, sensor histidine kinase CitS
MKKFLRVSLKVKILGLVILLMVIIIFTMSSIFIFLKLTDDIVKAKELTLESAKTYSYMPALHEYHKSGEPAEINILVEQIKYRSSPLTVFFLDRQNNVFATTDEERRYKRVHSPDHNKALIYGSYYVFQTRESGMQVLKAVAPVLVDYGTYKKVEGTVVVLYDMKAIYLAIWKDIEKGLLASVLILLIGIYGSYLLANSIRRDTLNLEPYEIAALFRERSAILQSVREGILAVDEKGSITMMNSSARELLEIERPTEGRPLSDVIGCSELLGVLGNFERQSNIEIQYNEKIMIVSTQPIREGSKRIGMVASFRDRTEIKQMIDALSEVRQYSDDLRAQAHEFSNKMYAILGLLQLNKKEEAIDFIKSETHIHTMEGDVLFSKIKDEKVQAILLGKIAQASEKKIQFAIDPESSLEDLPERIGLSSLIIILGNLLNNAFEAVKAREEREVSFFVTDIGHDVIFEVMDTGKGISEEAAPHIFQKGFSLKGENRGYGLGNVQDEVDSLGGSIEFTSKEGDGTIFTVYLPKEGNSSGKY